MKIHVDKEAAGLLDGLVDIAMQAGKRALPFVNTVMSVTEVVLPDDEPAEPPAKPTVPKPGPEEKEKK